MSALAISGEELASVRTILRDHLPPHVRASVFGSRARGTTKPWADLDLVLDGGEPLPLTLIATLADAFDESLLPWKVDIVDRRGVSEAFGAIIDKTQVPLD